MARSLAMALLGVGCGFDGCGGAGLVFEADLEGLGAGDGFLARKEAGRDRVLPFWKKFERFLMLESPLISS